MAPCRYLRDARELDLDRLQRFGGCADVLRGGDQTLGVVDTVLADRRASRREQRGSKRGAAANHTGITTVQRGRAAQIFERAVARGIEQLAARDPRSRDDEQAG